MHYVNPFTVVAFLELIQFHKAPAIIQTAGASQLGKMMNRVCLQKGYPVINVVRRQEQVDLLTEMGCKFIINSSLDNFEENLSELVKQLRPNLCFEAVSGTLSGQILGKMPPESFM